MVLVGDRACPHNDDDARRGVRDWREFVEVRCKKDIRNVHQITEVGVGPLAVLDEYERLVAAAPKPQRRRA